LEAENETPLASTKCMDKKNFSQQIGRYCRRGTDNMNLSEFDELFSQSERFLANVETSFMPDKYNSDRILLDKFFDDARGAMRAQTKAKYLATFRPLKDKTEEIVEFSNMLYEKESSDRAWRLKNKSKAVFDFLKSVVGTIERSP
jgi:hypothetical protein